MPTSGLSVNPKCVDAFNELKLGRQVKYVIYKISDDQKEIVVDEKGSDGDWEKFRETLIQKKDDKGKSRPSYAVFDVTYSEAEGEGKRSKITFITYVEENNTAIKAKMVYASSRETLKNALSGIAVTMQANDKDELEWDSVVKIVSKGKAV